MTIELTKVFPIQAIENNFLVNGEGDITVGFHVKNPEVFALTKAELESNYRDFVSIIKMLPPGTIFHKQDFFYQYDYREERKDRNITEKADFELFFQKPVLGSYSNIYITFCNKEQYKRGNLKSSFIKAKDFVFENPFKGYEKRFGEIEKRILTIENSLKTLKGFEVKKMDNKALGCALYDYFSASFENPSNNYERKLPPMEVKNDSLVIGDNIVKILSLVTEGSSLYSWKENITAEAEVFGTKAEYIGDINLPTSYVYPIGMGLPVKHILNTTIEVLDNEMTEKELRNQIPGLKLLASLGNTPSKHKAAKIEEFVENIAKFDYRSCRTTINIILIEKHSAKERMDYLVSVAQNAFSKLNGAQAWVENYDTANLFFGSCPGNSRENPRDFMTTVDQAVCYISKEAHYLSSKNGYLYCDRFGKPVFVNLLESPHITNKNGVCFGPSGSGKSFWFNGFIDQSLRQNHHFIILDVGASYKMNCELNGGFYFDCSDVSKLSFNLFANCPKDKNGRYLYKQFDSDGEGGEDKINAIYTAIRQIWKKAQTVTSEERVIMQKMIEKYYDFVNKNEEYPDFKGFVEYSKVFEKEMDDEEKGYFDFKGFRLVSKPFVSGVYKNFLNSNDNLDLSKQNYIVFDVKGLEGNEDIRDLLSVIIVQLTLDKIAKLPLSVKKVFLIDEALDFLKGDIGDFIGAMYRKIRKQGGAVLLATQDVSFLDEADPIVAKSIMKNSDIRILLGIEGKESVLKDVQVKLDLTENDIEKLRSMKKTKRYREFFVKLGNYAQVYRNQVSLTSALAYTTEPGELDAIGALKERYNHLGTSLNELVEIIKLINSEKQDDEIMKIVQERYGKDGVLDERLKKFIQTKMN